MAIVFGVDIPVLEFLLILNIIMLFYVIISMFEIRSLVKLRKDLEELLEDFKITGIKPAKAPQQTIEPEKTVARPEVETYSKNQ